MSAASHHGRGPGCRRRAKIDDLATHRQASVTVQQLAEYWDVHTQTVSKWIRAGVLPAFRVGRALRVRCVDAVRFER